MNPVCLDICYSFTLALKRVAATAAALAGPLASARVFVTREDLQLRVLMSFVLLYGGIINSAAPAMLALRRSLLASSFKAIAPFSGARCMGSSGGNADSPSPKSCLILGATSSISFEVVRLLLGRGVRVLATGRDEPRLKELQDMGAATMQVDLCLLRAWLCPSYFVIIVLFESFIFVRAFASTSA